MADKLNYGDIAIIDFLRFSTPKKIEVLEVTETTYLLLDLDFEQGQNYLIDSDYIVKNNIDTKQVIEDFKKSEMTFSPRPLEPSIQPLCSKFRITKEEFKKSYQVIEIISTIEDKIKREKFWGSVLESSFKNKNKID